MTPLPGHSSTFDWSALGTCLSRDLCIFTAARRKAFFEEWKYISEAEQSLDDRLVVGLIGGTGVGKSTLINALAGKEISATGERRPTTDRVIAYRHERTSLPDDVPRVDLAEPQVLHTTATLERVLVLDFPDFDSVDEVHHEILGRYLPHLDVLLVLVDDVKYGDRRLFELLRGVSQSSGNLHAVLNKVDRLENRYPGRSADVIREILEDLDEKLREHAGVHLGKERLLAVSARAAFLERSGAGRAEAGDVGDFPRIVTLLEGYREEKRRRAAKELNLEARKSALVASLRRKALDPRLLERTAGAERLLAERQSGLERTVAAIPRGIFAASERRLLVAASLRREAAGFGFPVDFFVTLLRELRPVKFSGKESPGEFSVVRIRSHYRAYLEGLRNAERDLDMETGDFIPTAPGDTSGRGGVAGQGAGASDPSKFLETVEQDLQRSIGAAEAALAARSRFWNHALPLVALLGFLWSLVYPAVQSAVGRALGKEGESWDKVMGELMSGLIGALSPSALVGLALSVVFAYVVTSVVAWVRQVQRLENAVTEQEASVRARIRLHGATVLKALGDRLAAWRADRDELERLLGNGAEAPGK